MSIHFSLFLATLLLAGSLCACANAFGPNLVPNGNFERGDDGWEFTGPYPEPTGPDERVGAATPRT